MAALKADKGVPVSPFYSDVNIVPEEVNNCSRSCAVIVYIRLRFGSVNILLTFQARELLSITRNNASRALKKIAYDNCLQYEKGSFLCLYYGAGALRL